MIPLPRVLEVKRTLDGREKRFECRLLAQTENGSERHVVLLFVAESAMHVHGVDLPAGTVTFGHFWTARPYNVYHWLNPHDGATIGAYFNLSRDTRIAPGGEGQGWRLDWQDVVVDLMLLPGQDARVLDEDEIPGDTPAALRQHIAAATRLILRDAAALTSELESHRAALWPLAATALRGPGPQPTPGDDAPDGAANPTSRPR